MLLCAGSQARTSTTHLRVPSFRFRYRTYRLTGISQPAPLDSFSTAGWNSVSLDQQYLIFNCKSPILELIQLKRLVSRPWSYNWVRRCCRLSDLIKVREAVTTGERAFRSSVAAVGRDHPGCARRRIFGTAICSRRPSFGRVRHRTGTNSQPDRDRDGDWLYAADECRRGFEGGRSMEEAVVLKPTADFDAKWAKVPFRPTISSKRFMPSSDD